MTRIGTVAAIGALALAAVVCDPRIAPTADGDQALGEKIVRQLWADVKASDSNALEKWIAAGYQFVDRDRVRDRRQEIEAMKGLNLGTYELSKFNVTRNGPTMVVTYAAKAPQTIDGKRLSGETARRLSVFLQTETGWQLIAHASFMPTK